MPEQLGNYIEKEVADGADPEDVRKKLEYAGFDKKHIDKGQKSIGKIQQHYVSQPPEPGFSKPKKMIIGIVVIMLILALIIFLLGKQAQKTEDKTAAADDFDKGSYPKTLSKEEMDALEIFDIRQGRTFEEIQAEIDDMIAKGMIEKGEDMFGSYKNYEIYRKKEIKAKIDEAVSENIISEGKTFAETAKNYKDYLKKENLEKQKIELAVKYGFIKQGATFAETKDNYEQYLKKRKQTAGTASETKELSQEYIDCAAENNIKYSACMAAIKRDPSFCDYEDGSYAKDMCMTAFAYSEAIRYSSDAGCRLLEKEDMERCMLAVRKDLSACNLQESKKEECENFIGTFIKLSSGDEKECETGLLGDTDICLSIIKDKESGCLEYDDSLCPPRYKQKI